MKTKRRLSNKIVSFVLTFVLILVCLQGGALTAFAAETAKDGLEVSLVTDKGSYDAGETITVTLTVVNTNDVAVQDVALESMIPEGYAPADGDQSVMQLDSLAAGDTATLTVRLVPEQADAEDPTPAPTPGTGGDSDSPDTSEHSYAGWWILLMILSATGMTVLAVKYRFGKRLLAVVLCVAMMATMVPAMPLLASAEEDELQTIEISTTVQVDGEPVVIRATVTYGSLVEDEDDPAVNYSTFYKVDFGYPDSMTEEDRKAVYLPEELLVYENALVYAMDEPLMDGYVFAAWFYDSALTQMADAEDVITKDTTLYPLMLKDTANTDGMPSNNYVAALDVTDLHYAVTVKAPSLQAVKDGLIWLEISKGGILMDITVTDNGNGTYTVRTVEPLEVGKTYQLRVQDREQMPVAGVLVNTLDSYIRFYHNGELQSIDVEYYNIFTAAQEVNNLKLSNGMVLIPIDQVTGIDLEEAVSLISMAQDENGEMGIQENAQTGSFRYTGDKKLQPGDIAFIFDGDPAAVEAEYTNSGTVAAATNSTFVKIASVEGDTYYYGTPELNEVLFMPDVLPIHLAEETDGNPEDNTITVADSCLDFRILPEESAVLDENTVAEPGDFIAFYNGTLEDPGDVRYAKILTVERADGFTTITFESATLDDIQSSIDSYVRTHVDVDLTEQEQVLLENKAVQQAMDSGFAEEAAALAVQEKLGLEETVVWGRQYPMTRNMAQTMSAEFGPEVDIEDFEIDAGMFLLQLQMDPPDVHANITSNLQRITTINGGEGVRVAFGVYIPVGIEVVNAFTQEVDESLKMDLYVTMEQEFAFDLLLKADYGVDLSWLIWESDAWVDMEITFDIGTYTGVGAVVMIDTEKNYQKSYLWDELIENDGSNGAFTSAESLADQLNAIFSGGDSSFFNQYKNENGNSTLIDEYRKMLQKDTDYMDILAIPLVKYRGKIVPTTPIGDYRLSLELVFTAKVNVTLGTSFETMNVKRYSFSIKASLQDGLDAWANPVVDKQTPYHSLNLMIMGNIGLRAGFRFTAQVGLLSVKIANVGMMVEIGAYIDIYGFGYFHYDWSSDTDTNIQKAGALYVDIGLYMDIDLSINALMDMLTATFHVLEMEVSFFRLGTREYLVDVVPSGSSITVSQKDRYDVEVFTLGTDVYRIQYVDIVDGSISYRVGHPANFVFQLPAAYQDKLTYRREDLYGNITHQFYVNPSVDELKLEIPVRVVFGASMNQAKASSLDSLYDLIGEAAGTKTVKWSRGKTKFSIFYNNAVPKRYYGENGHRSGSNYVTLTELTEMNPIPSRSINHLAPKVPGMDFAGWEVKTFGDDESLDGLVIKDFTDLAGREMIGGNIYLDPLYTPRSDTKYTVRHWLQSLSDPEEYEVYLEEAFTGTSFDAIKATDYYRHDITGISANYDYDKLPFTAAYRYEYKGEEYAYFNFHHSIRNDGKTVIDLYYDRDTCRVTVVSNNILYPDYGTASPGVTTQVKFGAPVVDPGYADTVIPGFTFLGWSTTADGSSGILDTLPDSLDFTVEQMRNGIVYYAIWKPEKVDCTVSFYLQDPYGEYQFLGTEEQQIDCGTRLKSYILKPETIAIPDIDFDGRVEAYTDVPYTGEYITYDPEGYTIRVYYDQSYYKVVFNPDVQYYLWGEEAIVPTAEKTGYKFMGWKSWNAADTTLYQPGDAYKVTATPTYFFPVFVEADDVQYTVNHYQERFDGTYSEDPDETETFFDGVTGGSVSPAVKSYTGFESPAQKTVRVEADGSTVVEYYYKRKTYPIRVDFAVEGENLILRGKYVSSYKYDVPFGLSDPDDDPIYIVRDGYELVGWYWADDPNRTLLNEYYWVKGDALTSEKELVFKPLWKKVEYGYTVEHYVEQLDGSYSLQKTEDLKGEYESRVTGQASTFSGFTFDETNSNNVLSGTVVANDALVLKLYYTRNSYDAKWYDYNGTDLLATTQFKFGETVTPPTVSATREGYTFSNWNIDNTTMPIGGLHFNAQDHGVWAANTYTVTFKANGGTGTMADQTLTYDRTQSLSPNAFTRSGYTFEGWSLTADGDVTYADQAQVTNLVSSGSVTLYAQWELGAATAYKVEYYGETLDGTGYEIIKTEDRTGVTASNVTATAIDIAGFTYDATNSGNVLSGVIAADGSLVLKLYYTRNSYTLTLDFNGESMKRAEFSWDTLAMEILNFDVADQTFTYRYGQTIPEQDFDAITLTVYTGNEIYDESTETWVDETKELPFKEAFAGYTFSKWEGICDTMPAEDLTLTAQWTAMDVTVKMLPGINYNNGQQVAGDPITITAKYGDVIDLSSYGFTADGYFMSGWNYHPDMTAGTEIVGELVLLDGYYRYMEGYSVSGGNETYNIPAGEVHIVGSWVRESAKCTITFDPNCTDYTGLMTEQVAGTDSKWTALKRNLFVRKGYRFIGWSLTADGDVFWQDGSLPTWEEEKATLYAQWEKIEES